MNYLFYHRHLQIVTVYYLYIKMDKDFYNKWRQKMKCQQSTLNHMHSSDIIYLMVKNVARNNHPGARRR